MAKLRYRKISVAIWNDEKFREASPECKLVFLCVLTHPLMTSFGAMRGSEGSIRDELQIPAEGFTKGYREALAKGFLKADPKACLIVVPKFLKHNQPDSPNVIRSWFALMDNLPSCALLTQYLQQVKGYTEGYGEGFLKAFREGYSESLNSELLTPSSELGEESGTNVPSGGVGDSPPPDLPSKPPEKPKRPKSAPKSLDMVQAAEFQKFWEAYPKKENKPDAEKAWGQMNPPLETVLKTLDDWQRADFLGRDSAKYIPGPGPYLRGKRWEDEKPAQTFRNGLSAVDRSKGHVNYVKESDPTSPFYIPSISGMSDEEWEAHQKAEAEKANTQGVTP